MVKPIPIKPHWIDRAVEVHNFHCQLLKDEIGWTIEKTANTLNRSVGSVSQDILIAQWMRTHEKQLRKFKTMKEALKFIRDKKNEMDTTPVDHSPERIKGATSSR